MSAPTDKQQWLAHWESVGIIAADCKNPDCRFAYQTGHLPTMAPRHTAKKHCESGRRPHCSCDACF